MRERIIANLQRFHQLMIRIPLGLIFIAHGGQNLFGWWGGPGFVQSVRGFEMHLGIPPALGALALFIQFGGGVFVLVGLLTRAAALGLAVLMSVAIWRVHLVNGFYLNWRLAEGRGHGIEMNLALLGMSLALVCAGGGPLALDRIGKSS